MPFQRLLTFLLIAAIASSCASSYKPVIFERLSFYEPQNFNGVEVSYALNIQRATRNGWYARKERKFNMVAIAVKVVNNTDEVIQLTPANLRLYGADGVPRRLFTPQEYGEKVRQRTGRHLLHTLYGPWIFVTEVDAAGNVDTNVFLLPVGAAVGVYNALRASKANRMNIETLNGNTIWNRILEPGEKVYGTMLAAGMPGERFKIIFE